MGYSRTPRGSRHPALPGYRLAAASSRDPVKVARYLGVGLDVPDVELFSKVLAERLGSDADLQYMGLGQHISPPIGWCGLRNAARAAYDELDDPSGPTSSGSTWFGLKPHKFWSN